MLKLALPPHRKIVRPVRPNVGIEVDYRKTLLALIDEMHRSVRHFVLQAYRSNLPHAHPERRLAQDASPAETMRATIARLTQRWTRKFNRRAPGVSKAMATAAQGHSDFAMRKALEKSGFQVKFSPTRAQNDAFRAVVNENVGLIKSIPQEYLSQVEGLVMRSVSKGRAVTELAELIEDRYKVAKSRAWLIARDQNNKATSVMHRARQRDLGIKKAIWVHTPSSIHPRESHLEADGEEFDLDKGLQIDGEFIFPGELINCGCISSSVIPGFDEEAEDSE